MPFTIVRNNIVSMAVDAIVNTANPRPVIGSGTDAAIHAAAGKQLLEARKEYGPMKPGQVCITRGYGLPAKYVIHTVGPVWQGGDRNEASVLRLCYRNSLELARQKGLASIAFPVISSGNYRFPKEQALQIAREEITDFLETSDMQVFLVVFDRETFSLSKKLTDSVRSFLDEHYVEETAGREYGFSVSSTWEKLRDYLAGRKEKQIHREELPSFSETLSEPEFDDNVYACEPEPCDFEESLRYPSASEPAAPKASPFSLSELKERLSKTEDGFSDSLLRLIDASGKKDSEVYRKANIDRKLFSKIRNNPSYKPTKATALAFAIALELDLEQTNRFLASAGYALSDSSKFDIIISYFIIHRRYDIHEINMTLFEFDQSLLGV